MKIILYRLIWMALVMIYSGILCAQEPDLTKLPDQPGKIKALLDYCESLRINSTGAADTYLKLQQAGSKGLQMLKPEEYTNRSKFLFYIAIGNYYQVKFDSAQYYFYQSLYNRSEERRV